MKLVEILAKKLDVWPTGAAIAVQDGDAQKTVKFGSEHANPSIALMGLKDVWQAIDWKYTYQSDFDHSVLAYDWKTAIVTKAQWQAERDRQKGGEWKRHRGGKQPVADDVRVEVKLRDGDVQEAKASAFLWNHSDCDVYANIMQYRIVSQPQAEEVEVRKLEGRDVRLEYLMTGNKLPYEVHCGEVIHGPISIGDEVVAPAHPKWDQVESPFKWRDTVNELDAYIEKFTRERDALINRLALEGFALIQKINLNLYKIDATLDMSDWRNWKAGDVVECTESDFENVYTVGNYYKVAKVTSEYARVQDDCGPESYCHINDVHCATLGFIRRP